MMSAGYIAAESRRAARIAARNHDLPMIYEGPEDVANGFPLPFIGDWRPRGYKLVNQLFCDSSGMGADDEPALSERQLLARLRPGYAYAVIEAGQFQVYLGEFIPPYPSAAQRAELLARQDLGMDRS